MVAAVVIGFTLLTPLAVLFPVKASAALYGEKFEWVDYYRLKVSGGRLESTTLTGGSSGNAFQNSADRKPVYNHGGTRCYLIFSVLVDGGNTSGVLSVHDRSLDPPGQEPPTCQNSFGYNGQRITISGNRGSPDNVAETEDQRRITIDAFSDQSFDEAPDKVTMTLTNTGNDDKKEATAEKIGGSAGSKDARYSHTFKDMDPGDYKICVAKLFGEKCFSFKKEKGKAYSQTIGEGFDNGRIHVYVRLNANAFTGTDDVLGPVTVALFNKDGSQVGTTETDSMAADSGDIASVGVQGFFDNIKPGTYKICIPALKDKDKECQTKEKKNGEELEVIFKGLDAADAAPLLNAEDKGKPSCDLGFWALNYFGCPLSSAMLTAIGKFKPLVEEKTTYDIGANFDKKNPPGSNYYQIWNIFRTVALSIILLIGVAMIASEAFGFKLASAYGLRATLSRLIPGALFIILSWDIWYFLLTASNNLGTWIADFLVKPFEQTGFFENAGETGGFGNWFIQAGAIVVAVGFLGPVGILMTIALLFAAYGLAYIALVMWGWIVTFLIIISGPFIAFSVFKGTSALGNWYFTNVRAIFVLPLAVPSVFALAAIGAGVGRKSGGDAAGAIEVIALLIALIVIMGLFMNSKGIMGTVAGKIGGFGQRWIGQRGGRALGKIGMARVGKGTEKLKSGTFVPKWMPGEESMNKFTRGAFAVRGAGYNPMKMQERWRAKYSDDALARADEIQQSAGFKRISQNDLAMRAGLYNSEGEAESGLISYDMRRNGTDRLTAQKNARAAIAAVYNSGHRFGDQGLRMAAHRQMSVNGSAWNGEEGGLEDAMGAIRDIAGTDQTTIAALVGGLKAGTARVDTSGASFASYFDLANKVASGGANHRDFVKVKVEASRNVAAHQALGTKEGGIREIAKALNEDLQYQLDQASRADTTQGRAEAERKAIENVTIQNRYAAGGAYAGVAGVAAMHDVTSRSASPALHPDARNREEVQQMIARGMDSLRSQQVYTKGKDSAGNIIYTSEAKAVQNPSFSPEAHRLNEEARRSQALSGMPVANQQQHDIMTGGGS